MSLFDLEDRLSWRQAAEFLGVSKSAFFRLVSDGEIPSYGAKETAKIYLKSDCRAYLARHKRRQKKRLCAKKSASVSKN